MALRSRSGQPRRAVADDVFAVATADPRKAVRRNRYLRSGIAGVAAGSVGVLAFAVPGMASNAAAANLPTATATALAESESRVGTTDAFAAREDTTSRAATREALTEDAVAAAAQERATALAGVVEQVETTQNTTALELRAAALTDTSAKIDAEAVRMANEDTFFWPTEGGISSPWGPRLHPILHYTRLHGGADIGGEIGAPIYAVLDGVVTKAAEGYNGGSGNNVRIDHGVVNDEALETAYLHMTDITVAVGQEVKRGQQIGTVGSTGLSTAPHLHFSVYVSGANSDPAPYLAAGQN